MPLRTKKWTRSKANQYISRSKACKKLQLSLPSFRKLCILKGIYPHDPKKKHRKEGDRRVYYHVKDIKNLRREPILWQWRNQKTFRNKIIKHKGRHNWDKVKRMQLNIPQISIDHLVRERYPTFNDALRDLDDCVTFMFLFSCLPSGIIPQLTSLRRMECQKLCKEFRNYIIYHKILKKSFISIKGIYYQCKFKNKYDVTFIVPHQFTHNIPQDVDYRVMSSFLDFYQTMFKFVLFKLYKIAHMKYPPFGQIDYDLTNLSLTKLKQQQFTNKRKIKCNNNNNNNKRKESLVINNKSETPVVVKLDLNKILNTNQLNNNNDDESKNKKMTNNNNNNNDNNNNSTKEWNRGNLFKDFKILLNRETPQMELEFVILSMGGKVIFEQECMNKKEKNDPSITHQIIDRKLKPSSLLNTRQYIQPQWIFDCLNTGAVIPCQHYQPGIQCPPHLSPFVTYNDESHKPSQAFVLEHWKKISTQFGGFVPSKKLKQKRKQQPQQEENQEKQQEIDDQVGMNLDITDIMDMDEISDNDNDNDNDNSKDNEIQPDENELDGFLDDDEEDGNNEMSINDKRESILEEERLKIANRERSKSMKEIKHSLETDGIAGDRQEQMKVNLARSIMSKKYRKQYDKIRRNKTKKSKHMKYMEQKRKRFEQKQMKSLH